VSAPAAEFRGVSRTFGEVAAVRDLSLTIESGEFFSLLGPSGCGKTTSLRLLAGFEDPDPGGRVLLHGNDVTGLRPHERGLSMVFQSYALFPHLSVERNVSFGLEQRRTPRPEISERVAAALELVRLDPDVFSHRMPNQLSGGQRQRVALARALVIEPSILLLDEPLGALDLKLRKQMQVELKELNRRLGITFVYVTHDQEEALAMSDRIAVMHDARVVQLGSPAEVYENPRTAFVAGFIGESNVLEGTAFSETESGWTVRRADGSEFRVSQARFPGAGRSVQVAVRPEWLDLFPKEGTPAEENSLPGVVRDVVYLGETMHVLAVLTDGQVVRVAIRNEGQLARPIAWKPGDAVEVGWLPEDAQVLEEGR
jgi:spermidine/putrescine transport system ATP-binding protein